MPHISQLKARKPLGNEASAGIYLNGGVICYLPLPLEVRFPGVWGGSEYGCSRRLSRCLSMFYEIGNGLGGLAALLAHERSQARRLTRLRLVGEAGGVGADSIDDVPPRIRSRNDSAHAWRLVVPL